MLTGKARGRQVLGSRRAAYCDRDLGTAYLFECTVGLGDLRAQMGRTGRLVYDLARGRRPLGQQRHIMMVEAREEPVQLIPGTSLCERVAVRLRRQDEAFGHPDALCREHPMEFA